MLYLLRADTAAVVDQLSVNFSTGAVAFTAPTSTRRYFFRLVCDSPPLIVDSSAVDVVTGATTSAPAIKTVTVRYEADFATIVSSVEARVTFVQALKRDLLSYVFAGVSSADVDVSNLRPGSVLADVSMTAPLMASFLSAALDPSSLWARTTRAGVRSSCGDGIRLALEECDDGNSARFDGCSSTCQLEGWPFVCTIGDTPVDRTLCGENLLPLFVCCAVAGVAALFCFFSLVTSHPVTRARAPWLFAPLLVFSTALNVAHVIELMGRGLGGDFVVPAVAILACALAVNVAAIFAVGSRASLHDRGSLSVRTICAAFTLFAADNASLRFSGAHVLGVGRFSCDRRHNDPSRSKWTSPYATMWGFAVVRNLLDCAQFVLHFFIAAQTNGQFLTAVSFVSVIVGGAAVGLSFIRIVSALCKEALCKPKRAVRQLSRNPSPVPTAPPAPAVYGFYDVPNGVPMAQGVYAHPLPYDDPVAEAAVIPPVVHNEPVAQGVRVDPHVNHPPLHAVHVGDLDGVHVDVENDEAMANLEALARQQ